MKRFLYIIIALSALAAACRPENAEVVVATRVNLSQESASLVIGKNCTLTASLYPEGVTKPGVVWSSLDEGIASVSSEGIVTAVSPGVTYIVATSADGRAKNSCMVSVKLTDGYFISILDEKGAPVDCLCGYPGNSYALVAESTDDAKHTYSWSSSAPDAVAVDNGVISFKYKPSDSSEYLCYGESTVSVRSEDGTSADVTAISSIFREFTISGMPVAAGSESSLNPDDSYNFVLWYSDGKGGRLPVPAGAYVLSSSASAVVGVEMTDDGYRLTTASSGSTRIRVTFPGSDPIVVADIKVAKSVAANYTASTSSTVTYTWTQRVGTSDDISRSWLIELFSDAVCKNRVRSFEIEAGHDCWNGKQPCFTFSGLAPDTSYWFVVTDTSNSERLQSKPIQGTTLPFTIVEPSDAPAAAGDVILAEDFGQMCWGGDLVSGAAGYTVPDYDVPTFLDSNASNFVKGSTSTSERLLGNHQTALNAPGCRIGAWAQGAGNNLYVHTGYIKMGTASANTHLITPQLNAIPEGTVATIEVTVTGSKWSSSIPNPVLAVQTGSFQPLSASSGQINSSVDLSTNKVTVSLGAYSAGWASTTVTLEGVRHGNRLAFGPDAGASGGNGRLMISEFTVKIVNIK